MKKSTTKRSLVLSAISLLLCVSMLVGSTFAWFTDSVTSTNNIIKSGTLDVELYYQVEGQTDWTKVTSSTNVFKESALWEPGHTEVVKLKVVNEGTLALKYTLGVNVESEIGSINQANQAFNLSDYIMYGIVDGAQDYTRDEAIAAITTPIAVKNAYLSDTTSLLAKNDTDSDEKVVTMVVYMPTTVGNEANAKSDAAVPTINLGINLFATQLDYEEDSFDKDYDINATLPKAESADVTDATSATTITVDNVSVTVPAGVPTGTYTVQVSNENESVDANGVTTYNFDVNLLKDGVKVQADGSTAYLVQVNIGADKVISKLLHKGEEITAFDYNSTTGILEFTTLSFSPFTVIFEENKVLKVGSVEELEDALAAVTEPVVIDATGVTLIPTGDVNTTVRIPAGVTLKGATFSATSQCFLIIDGVGEDVVFEDCTINGPGRGMFLIAGDDENGANVVFENSKFYGQIVPNFTANNAGTSTFNNCYFTLSNESIGYVNCMGGDNTFNNCTFDYTGGATYGSNQYTRWNAVNSYSERYTANVLLSGCTFINCGTQRFGSNSTLTVK